MWFQELTGNYPLRIKQPEGVVHKRPVGRGLIPPQFVLNDQSVLAVVDVGGLVEEEAAVFHRSVVRVRDELGVCELRSFEFIAVVQPGDVWLRVTVHSEGEAPVVLLHCVLQEEDFDWNCWAEADV